MAKKAFQRPINVSIDLSDTDRESILVSAEKLNGGIFNRFLIILRDEYGKALVETESELLRHEIYGDEIRFNDGGTLVNQTERVKVLKDRAKEERAVLMFLHHLSESGLLTQVKALDGDNMRRIVFKFIRSLIRMTENTDELCATCLRTGTTTSRPTQR